MWRKKYSNEHGAVAYSNIMKTQLHIGTILGKLLRKLFRDRDAEWLVLQGEWATKEKFHETDGIQFPLWNSNSGIASYNYFKPHKRQKNNSDFIVSPIFVQLHTLHLQIIMTYILH